MFGWLFNTKKKEEKLIETSKQHVLDALKDGIKFEIITRHNDPLPPEISPTWVDNSLPVKLLFTAGFLKVIPGTTDKFENAESATKNNLAEMPDYEINFFLALQSQTIAAGFEGKYVIRQCAQCVYDVAFCGNARGNVHRNVGRIKLRLGIPKYAVLKENAKRASQVFDNEDSANEYIKRKHGNYTIEKRCGEKERFMQYSRTLNTPAIFLREESCEAYIKGISNWIKYLKYLKRMKNLK